VDIVLAATRMVFERKKSWKSLPPSSKGRLKNLLGTRYTEIAKGDLTSKPTYLPTYLPTDICAYLPYLSKEQEQEKEQKQD